jgi:hypothetical protein
MAAPYNPPKKNEDFIIGVSLSDMATPGAIKTNPTIAAGDFKISKDFGAFANLATLPTVTPASGDQVKIELSSTEMNADNVHVVWKDQTSPKEWADGWMHLPTTQ